MEYYPVTERNEIMPFAAKWMDLGIIILSEVSQKRQISYNIAYNLKKMRMNLFTKQEETHRLRECIYGYQRGKIRRRNRWGAWDCHFNFLL